MKQRRRKKHQKGKTLNLKVGDNVLLKGFNRGYEDDGPVGPNQRAIIVEIYKKYPDMMMVEIYKKDRDPDDTDGITECSRDQVIKIITPKHKASCQAKNMAYRVTHAGKK